LRRIKGVIMFLKTSRFSSGHTLHDPSAPPLQIENTGFYFNGKPALSGVNLVIGKGEQIAVIGPNGAGKSTLFKIIAGILKPIEGTVRIFGSPPGKHGCIGYVPQHNQVDWQFPANVFDVVMMGRASRIGLCRQPAQADREKVYQALETVGLSVLAKHQISELSGGQQQRVFIARAMAQEAEIVLMDEPLNALDQASQNDLFEIFRVLRQKQVTLLVALHDLQIAASHFEKILLLNHTVLGFGRPAEILDPVHLVKAYPGHVHLVEKSPGEQIAIADTCCDHHPEADRELDN